MATEKNKIILPVSVIVANYNNASYLPAFMDSLLNSTCLPAEVILVDDGSKDDSAAVLQKYAHIDWIKVVYLPINKGLTYALNTALEMASEMYIMRADPDDILLPERIEKQVAFLESHPDVDICGCNVRYFQSGSDKRGNTSNFPLTHDAIAKRIQSGEHGVQHPTAMVRGHIYKRYRYQPLFPGEDYELFARMLKDGCKFTNLKEAFYLMRVHSGSSTSNLAFVHIQRTFHFRDAIFGTKTSTLWMWIYFQHIRLYRKYQISTNSAIGYVSLILSSLLYPSKVWDRFQH